MGLVEATKCKAAPPPASLIYRPPSYVERLELPRLFPKPQPVEVELGSGDGSFLVEWARRHPEHNFLGVERLLGRTRKLDRKGLRLGLLNLRGIRLEASYVLEYLLPPRSIQALHVYFPDPWPKRKHRKFRLINPRFTELAAEVLQPGGAVWLRTDDTDYSAQMMSVFRNSANFREVETPPELSGVLTDFEKGFIARGTPTLRTAFARL